jgi:hypothetical protein
VVRRSVRCFVGFFGLCGGSGGGDVLPHEGALAAGSYASHSRTSHSRGAGGFRPIRSPEEAMQCAARSSEGGLIAPRNAMAGPPKPRPPACGPRGSPLGSWSWVVNGIREEPLQP